MSGALGNDLETGIQEESHEVLLVEMCRVVRYQQFEGIVELAGHPDD